MAFTKSETDDIRHTARQELRPETDRLQDIEVAHRQTADAVAAVARAVERLSIVTMGDDKLGVKGLVVDMDNMKQFQQTTILDKAKVAGIWIGATAVGVGVARAVWGVISLYFAK